MRTTNNRFKQSRIFDRKTKIKFHSRTGNTWFHRELKSDVLTEMFKNKLIRMDTKGNEFLFWNMVFGLVTTPAKHVWFKLVHGHINLSLGLNIHQGLKIRYKFTHKYSTFQTVTPVVGSISGTLSQTHFSKSEFKNGHISRFCFVFQVIQVISSEKFFSAEEVDLNFISWIWIHESDSKASAWKRDRENPILSNVLIRG